MLCGFPYTPAVVYVVNDKPEGGQDYSAWFAAKPPLKERNPLMNLPYVIDHENGDMVVSQSNACMSYLGRQLGLWGNNDQEVRTAWLNACV